MALAPDWIRVGWVRKAHGLQGEVEVGLDWTESTSLLAAERVWLFRDDVPGREYEIRRARSTPKGVLVVFDGVVDREGAEALRGHLVAVPRANLPSLEKGEYFLSDLVGCTVDGPEGPIGEVVEIQLYPSVDAVVVRRPTGERVEQPLLDEWIERVDLDRGRLCLRSLDGLIELPGRN